MTAPTIGIGREAITLSTDFPDRPLTDLDPLRPTLDEARIVGIGDPVRGAHDLLRTGHRLLRYLVEELGFRTLAVETPRDGGERVDTYIRTGKGTAESVVRALWAPWHIQEFADVVRWLRDHNTEHTDDPVSFVGIDGPDLEDISITDRQFHDNLLRLAPDTGRRVAYWGGSAHATAADPTHIPAFPRPRTSAGALLRHNLGTAYVAVGLTLHRGRGREMDLPIPSPASVETALNQAHPGTFAVDLRRARDTAIRAWSRTAMATRVIGPGYTPETDQAYLMTGGTVVESFDVLMHHPEVGDATRLT
jgi:erythromycin esterase